MTTPQTIELQLALRYVTEKPIDQCEDLENYLMRVTAKIYGVVMDEELTGYAPEKIELGEITFIVIQVTNAIEENFSLYELFDESQELANVAGAIYTSGFSDYCPEILKHFPGFESIAGGDILLIDDIKLHPFAEGQHLEAIALRACVRDWQRGCDLALVLPYPQGISSSDAQMAGFKIVPGLDYQVISMAHLHIIPDLPNTVSFSREFITEQLKE